MNVDESTLAIAAANDSTAFARLYDRFFARVYSYVRYRSDDPQTAEDLTGQVFERALGSIRKYSSERVSFEAWMFAMARNVVNEDHRARRRRNWFPWKHFRQRSAVDLPIEEPIGARELRTALLAAIPRLDERERDLIALQFNSRLPNREIALISGMSENAIGVAVYRALKKLRVALGEVELLESVCAQGMELDDDERAWADSFEKVLTELRRGNRPPRVEDAPEKFDQAIRLAACLDRLDLSVESSLQSELRLRYLALAQARSPLVVRKPRRRLTGQVLIRGLAAVGLMAALALGSAWLFGALRPAPAGIPRSPTVLPASTPEGAPVHYEPDPAGDGDLHLIFARDNDLWALDLTPQEPAVQAGGLIEPIPLTEGGILNRLKEDVLAQGKPYNGFSLPSISPDGHWMAFSRSGKDLNLLHLADRSILQLPGSMGSSVDWAPDSSALAYVPEELAEGMYQEIVVYSLNAAQTYVVARVPRTQNSSLVHKPLWSPDSRWIAYQVCYGELNEMAACSLQKVEAQTGQVETVQDRWPANQTLCWLEDGQLSQNQGVRCTGPSSGAIAQARSADGKMIATLEMKASGEGMGGGSLSLSVASTLRQATLWTRSVGYQTSSLAWSPDGKWLYLDDGGSDSPIWRLLADGSGDLEPWLENAYLIGVHHLSFESRSTSSRASGASGGQVMVGDFTFKLAFAKDPEIDLNPQMPSGLRGMAVELGWSYHGKSPIAGPVAVLYGSGVKPTVLDVLDGIQPGQLMNTRLPALPPDDGSGWGTFCLGCTNVLALQLRGQNEDFGAMLEFKLEGSTEAPVIAHAQVVELPVEFGKSLYQEVVAGDTLAKIADAAGLSPEFLRRMNGLTSASELGEGQKLLIGYSWMDIIESDQPLTMQSLPIAIRQRILRPTWRTLWLEGHAAGIYLQAWLDRAGAGRVLVSDWMQNISAWPHGARPRYIWVSQGKHTVEYDRETSEFTPGIEHIQWGDHPLENSQELMALIFPRFLEIQTDLPRAVEEVEYAGRQALVVLWDNDRFWVDEQSGLILKQEHLSGVTGAVAWKKQLDAVTVDPPLPADVLRLDTLDQIRFDPLPPMAP